MDNKSYVCDFGEAIELNSDLKSCTEPQLAVDISNAEFGYRRNVKVLDNLSLKVPKGRIFALLGPNGCGKTTLIRSTLGRLKLESGSIRVFGIRPGSSQSDIPGPGVGYMPQDLALFEEFTIREILTYYGTIYHFEAKELKQRIEEMLHILNLPEKSRLINQLSGGQQRRVSIAITMIHKPKLIILDEPTVGVDSLLRCRIWQYLEEICRTNGQTVIITTHYIEEARAASNVAFMTAGRILRQANPQKLLAEYQCKTLEEVFLSLCQQKTISKPSEIQIITESDNNNERECFESEEKVTEYTNDYKLINKTIDFKRIIAMLWKYYILTNRRPLYLVMFYVIPLIALFTMNYSIGQAPYNLPIAIYNEDLTPKLSQLFIDTLDKKYLIVNEYQSNESAFESVVKGKSYLSIVFNKNFSEAFDTRLADMLEMTDEDLDNSQLSVYIDFSNGAIGAFVLKYLLQTFKAFVDKLSPTYNYNIFRYVSPLAVTEVIYGQLDLDVSGHFGPSALIIIAQCLPMVLSAFQIVTDRKTASFERVFCAGVRPIEYFIAHMVQNFILILTQVLFTMFISFVCFNNTQMGSYIEVFIMLLLQGLLGMAIGLMGALILADEVSVAVGVTGFMLPLWIMSGVLWPLESIPNYFRYFSDLSPITRPLDALRSVMLRGWNYQNPAIIYGYIFSFGYFLIISICNVFLFHKDTEQVFGLNLWTSN